MLGMDGKKLLSQGSEDYLIDIALLQKAMKLSSEQKVEEIKVLAELIGLEVAKTIAKIF
jgi:hypothetical protein